MENIVNRRAAVAAIAAGSAMLAVPAAAALASHPDAELFALSRRARALYAKYLVLSKKYRTASEAMEKPPVPEPLICREKDGSYLARGAINIRVGEQLPHAACKEALSFRDCTLWMCGGQMEMNEYAIGEYGAEKFRRCCEIARHFEQYDAACDAARDAAGLPALEDEMDSVDDERAQVYRAIAFMPAGTVEGVLAKLAACADEVVNDCPLDPEDNENVSADRVAEAAAIDYAALLKAQEA